MFGITTFSQVAFSTLPVSGTAYAESVTEDIGVADILVPSLGITATRVEPLTAGDTEVIGSIYYLTRQENLNSADSAAIGTGYIFAIQEGMTLADIIKTSSWTRVNDSQTGSWTPVNDAQTNNWNAVNDSQTGNWVDIDDTQ